ncbi:MAG: hypothetical protein R3D03_13410 [Geminicoccaceae bacterium]
MIRIEGAGGENVGVADHELARGMSFWMVPLSLSAGTLLPRRRR